MNLIRAATTVGGFTLVSRVAGFARDVLMARYLGAGLAADAFLVAFRLPNLFRSLFAEGAFSAAFVPMAAERLEQADGPARARRFTEQALAFLLPILMGFTALMMLLAGPVVLVMTGGFRDAPPEKLALTIELTRLTFPYLMLISLTALFGGLLNAVGRFAANAAAPILLNITLIGGLLLGRETAMLTARDLAVAVSIAGMLQFAWLFLAVHRAGLAPRLTWPRLTPDIRTLLRRIGPAAIGAGATQLNLLVSTVIAARFLPQGSVSYLYYADRLNQLPLGMIGVGVGVALLPTLARNLGSGQLDAARYQQNRAIEFAMFLALPAATALVVAAHPIVAALFQDGRFTAQDARASAAALQAFALGLPAYILVKVLTPGYHARGNTRTPMNFALVAIAANLVGNLTLVWSLAHVGIALSTAISAWLNVVLLAVGLARSGALQADAQLRRTLPRMILAAVLMGAILFVLLGPALPLATGRGLDRVAALLLLVVPGVLVYFGAGTLIGAWQPRALLAAFRRPRPAPADA
jgi:putative peptidoglycan lipid II flippase